MAHLEGISGALESPARAQSVEARPVTSSGFYKRRRGILEHIDSGEIDLLESGIHDYLLLKANLLIGSACSIPVGVCFTSAPAIHAHCRRVSERTIQRCLEHLEDIGLLKTWKTTGKRDNFPVLVCRASVQRVGERIQNKWRKNNRLASTRL